MPRKCRGFKLKELPVVLFARLIRISCHTIEAFLTGPPDLVAARTCLLAARGRTAPEQFRRGNVLIWQKATLKVMAAILRNVLAVGRAARKKVTSWPIHLLM